MAQKIYEDLEFIPKSEILGETDATIPTVIMVYLPGFKIRELKVTHDFGGSEPEKIRITGERPLEGNKWRRFEKEFPIPPDCDTGVMKARLEGGILRITLPKKTDSAQKTDELKESGQEQQAKGQTDTANNNSQASTKAVAPPEHKRDHQKPTDGTDDQTVQETKNKTAEEPAASQVKGKASVSEEVPKPEESKSHTPQAKGQTNGTSQASAKAVAPPEPKPDQEKPSNGSVQETNKKKEPTADHQVKGEVVSEEVPKSEETKSHTPPAKGQTNTSQASAKVTPQPKPSHPDQKPTDGDGKETWEEASSEAVGGGCSDPPPQPQESNKKAEEQESSKPANPQVNEKAVSEEVPKPEEPKNHTQQAKPTELKDATSETTTDNKKEEGDTKNTDERKGYECTFAEIKLRRRRKTLNLALMVLAGIGIGLYVKNMIRSYGGEAEE